MKRCVILSAVPLGSWAKSWIKADDYIIACDAGYKNAERLSINADLVLGDFDSAPRPSRKDAIVLPTEKDDTDTHYAARIAVQNGFDKVLMLGALGGMRIEHTLANFATALWLAKQGIRVELANENSRITYVLPEHPVRLEHHQDEYFSLLPMEGTANGVCVRNAKYSIENVQLTPEFPVGVSNETLKGGTEVLVGNGTLLLIRTKKDSVDAQ